MNRLGPVSLLSPIQKDEAIAWFKAKQALGSFKSKAKEMDVPVYALEHFLYYQKRKGKL